MPVSTDVALARSSPVSNSGTTSSTGPLTVGERVAGQLVDRRDVVLPTW